MQVDATSNLNLKLDQADGWLQGSLVKFDDLVEFLNADDLERLDLESLQNNKKVFVVVSQSCDVLARFDLEPEIEFILAVVLEGQLVKDFQYGRQPRKLHISTNRVSYDGITDLEDLLGEDRDYLNIELSIRHRVLIKKENLKNTKPLNGISISSIQNKILRDWLAARYNRPANPDSFNVLLKKDDARRKKLLKNINLYINEIYISFLPQEEIESGKYIYLDIIFVAEDSLSDEQCESINKFADTFKCVCDEPSFSIKSSKDLSLHVINNYIRLDFDYLTNASDLV